MVFYSNENLSEMEKAVMFDKETEPPFSGKYNNFQENGVFVCKNCNHLLYSSDSKFSSNCGWPAFEENISNFVEMIPDLDGERTEIICNKCKGHLGHIFFGEKLTSKNTRHCVNSVSLKFIPKKEIRKIVLGCGCFWGVQYWFEKLEGIINSQVGYAGGTKNNPSYEEVCSGNTGHYEVLELTYATSLVSLEKIIKYFFEIHDFTQIDGQGNDLGEQYLSVIFYNNIEEKEICRKVIKILEKKKFIVATKLLEFKNFWPAEDKHQNYYKKNHQQPYCHFYNKIF